jgi:hypothetical protein
MLASHLVKYLGSPALRAEHGQRNRELAQNRFSIQAMVDGYEAVWRRIAKASV